MVYLLDDDDIVIGTQMIGYRVAGVRWVTVWTSGTELECTKGGLELWAETECTLPGRHVCSF